MTVFAGHIVGSFIDRAAGQAGRFFAFALREEVWAWRWWWRTFYIGRPMRGMGL